MNTVLITGCSSGFGVATAKYFLERDWRVIATMRTPNKDILPYLTHLQIVELDVSDASAIAAAISTAGPIDVLVNNAGIGIMAALEATSMQTAEDIFATNTLGVIAMTRAVVQQFRSS